MTCWNMEVQLKSFFLVTWTLERRKRPKKELISWLLSTYQQIRWIQSKQQNMLLQKHRPKKFMTELCSSTNGVTVCFSSSVKLLQEKDFRKVLLLFQPVSQKLNLVEVGTSKTRSGILEKQHVLVSGWDTVQRTAHEQGWKTTSVWTILLFDFQQPMSGGKSDSQKSYKFRMTN